MGGWYCYLDITVTQPGLAVVAARAELGKSYEEYQPSGAGGTRSPPATPNCPLNPKWPTGSGKRLNLRLFDPPINFR